MITRSHNVITFLRMRALCSYKKKDNRPKHLDNPATIQNRGGMAHPHLLSPSYDGLRGSLRRFPLLQLGLQARTHLRASGGN